MAVPKKIITRQVSCPIFWAPKDFLPTKFPTGDDLILCCSHKRYGLAFKINNKSVSFLQFANIVTKNIIDLYQKLCITTRIMQFINTLHDKYYKLWKSYTHDKNKELFKQKIVKFKQKCSLLFEVAACKCPIIVNCIFVTKPLIYVNAI